MSYSTDHYATLGLISSAEPEVIRAAYKVLSSIYHPDKNSSKSATAKMQEINLAYSILSNPTKKAEYDKSRKDSEHKAGASDFDSEASFKSKSIDEDWQIAIDFHPNIWKQYSYLKSISWRMAFAFKLKVLNEKLFSNSEDIATNMKRDYLSKYFGKDEAMQHYAEQLIELKFIDAALELNKIIKVLSESISINAVKNKLNTRFPGLKERIQRSNLYNRVRRGEYISDKYLAAKVLVVLDGGEPSSVFFGETINLKLKNGDKLKFENRIAFIKFVLTNYNPNKA